MPARAPKPESPRELCLTIMHWPIWPDWNDPADPPERPLRWDSFPVFIGPAAAGERLRRFITDPTGHIRIPETPNAPGTDAGGAWLHVCDARDLIPADRRRDEAAIADALGVTPTRELPAPIREIIETGELFAEQEGAAAPAGNGRRGAGGRPKLKPADERKRLKLVDDWDRAKGAYRDKLAFCDEHKTTVEHLDRCVDWKRARERRARG